MNTKMFNDNSYLKKLDMEPKMYSVYFKLLVTHCRWDEKLR